MTEEELLWEADELPNQTRDDFYCEKHKVINLRNALGQMVCPVCIMEAVEKLK